MYEIQYHPADIRKQVRYYFLSRRAFRWTVAGAGVLALFLLAGVVLAPLGVQSVLLSSELHVLEHQNRLQREILGQREGAVLLLQGLVDAARLQQQQIGLILGASQEAQGLGGFPEVPEVDITVPAAQLTVRQAARLRSESTALLTLADELARFASENEELTRSVPSVCPLPIGSFVLTSPFGDRVSPFTGAPDFHAGVDLAAREGTPVFATGEGRVVFSGRFPLSKDVGWWRYGNVVVLDHGLRYLSIYAHLEGIGVVRGATVARGEQLGTVGNSGWSTSPHLHYEVRLVEEEGEEPFPVDPRIYILNYQWKGHEAVLVDRRSAPAPAFDPLPERLKGR